jgi:hypothetical protein
MNISFPSQRFGPVARDALYRSESIDILVKRSGRYKFIEKSIHLWPKTPIPDADFAKQAGWSWTLCNLLFPTLLVIHWALIKAGYKMNYSLDEKELRISYLASSGNNLKTS